MCMGRQEWVQSVTVLDKYSPWHRTVFSVYIVLIMIGTLNVLIGIFVGKASEVHALDGDSAIQSEIARQTTVVQEKCGIFLDIDKTCCGSMAVHQRMEWMVRTVVNPFGHPALTQRQNRANYFRARLTEDRRSDPALIRCRLSSMQGACAVP